MVICSRSGQRINGSMLSFYKTGYFSSEISMIWLMSITYIGSLWIFEIDSITELISLPFVGGLATIAGGLFAVRLANYLKYNRLDTGSIVAAVFFLILFLLVV